MTLQIMPLGRAMGAEVTGVDLGGPLAPEVRDQLYQAFLDHLLLCFRDQTLDHDGFLRAARHFGDPKVQLLEGYRIDGLRAVHNYAKRRPGRKVPKLGAAEKAQTPPVEHPIARSHDETRRKALYVHETMTDYVAGLAHYDSEILLEDLYRHSTGSEDLQYRHQWRQGDFVMWDDRCTLHAATADYAETERRLLYRTLLAGVSSA